MTKDNPDTQATAPAAGVDVPSYTVNNLPAGEWGTFRKKVTTLATRIRGPFTVLTSEGPLHCQDGWLARDARGYPYPIATDEFALIYEPTSPDSPFNPSTEGGV